MSFVVPLGLLVALAVIGPLVAHLLRRRRPEERPFAAARFVPPAPPVARRRANLEDRWLLSIRALAILLLALLAASPLVRCQRIRLDRKGGASVAIAIVIDDSMSMNALLPPEARRGGATTRFELAMVAARELASSLQSGDATTIVLAGGPARVALAPTQEATAVRSTIESLARLGASDRATDLDGAIKIAAAALSELPQPDRRIVLLSDRADGDPGGAPLASPEGKGIALEVPIDALTAPPPAGLADCAVLSATPEGDTVRARLSCALAGGPVGSRSVEIVLTDAATTRVGIAALPPSPPAAPLTFDVVVPIAGGDPLGRGPSSLDRQKAPALAPEAGRPKAFARLTGGADALARDDLAPVLGAATAPALAVVVGEGGALDEVVATGGAPILERALNALQPGVPIRPIPTMPDRDVDLAPFAGIAVDDPAAFGPEARTALAEWVERGGVLLIALGPHAASPQLGSSFEPFLTRPVRWERLTGALGIDPGKAGPLGDGVDAPKDLAPKGRALLDREDENRFVTRAAWTNGGLLFATRAIGQGEVWITTVPFAPELSDLPISPSFLALLDAFVSRARDRGAGARLTVGEGWTVGPNDALEVVRLDDHGAPISPSEGGGPLAVEKLPDGLRVSPARVGAYLVSIAAKGSEKRLDVRAVVPSPSETELRPRAVAPAVATGTASGLSRTRAELGPYLAFAIVALAAIELVARAIRAFTRRADDAAETAPTSETA